MQQRVRPQEEPSSLLELTRWGWESREIKVARVHRAEHRHRKGESCPRDNPGDLQASPSGVSRVLRNGVGKSPTIMENESNSLFISICLIHLL